MDFKFSKGSSDAARQEPPAEKKNQNALLILLLILVGGFSYIYLFTGLIKPSEVAKPAETLAPQIVKMPLPSREGDTASVGAITKDQKNEAAPSKVPPVPSAKAQVIVAAVAPAAKAPVPQPAKPKMQAPAEKKTESVVKSADRKSIPEITPAKPKKMVVAAHVSAKEAAGHSWVVMVGHYVLEEVLATDLGRVRKAGFDPVVKPGARKKTSMHRLMFAEFPDRSQAQAAVVKLKRQTSDTFIIDQGGKHIVYAGSYLLDESAASEKKRLDAAGFPVTLKRIEIAIPSQSLTIGPFSDKTTADAALGKLKAAGIDASLIRK